MAVCFAVYFGITCLVRVMQHDFLSRQMQFFQKNWQLLSLISKFELAVK